MERAKESVTRDMLCISGLVVRAVLHGSVVHVIYPVSESASGIRTKDWRQLEQAEQRM